ncbi:MAG: nuclear transport factor 2 family protein [Acidobacteriaceae bacterium]|nr:nuclear transport factor 2 family protein [Acidobacteriaceae bacterium]
MCCLLVAVGSILAQDKQNKISSREQDLASIWQLHAKDAAAAKAGDVSTLETLWTADAVALPPGEEPVIGIEAIRAWLHRTQGDPSKVQTTQYQLDFREVTLAGNEAVEWGTSRVAVSLKDRPGTAVIEGNIMRVLKRQPDGSWKIARSIWNFGNPARQPSNR